MEEWRSLGRAARQLQASAETLTRSTWQGAPAVLVNLAQAHEVIATMYNRAEPMALRHWKEDRPRTPQERSEGGSPSGSSPEPSGVVPVKAVA
jgi:hypothetical protein